MRGNLVTLKLLGWVHWYDLAHITTYIQSICHNIPCTYLTWQEQSKIEQNQISLWHSKYDIETSRKAFNQSTKRTLLHTTNQNQTKDQLSSLSNFHETSNSYGWPLFPVHSFITNIDTTTCMYICILYYIVKEWEIEVLIHMSFLFLHPCYWKSGSGWSK